MAQIARLKDPEISNGEFIIAEDLDDEFNQLVAESNSQDNRITAIESGAINISGVKTFTSNPKMDGVSEKTTGAGFTADSVLMKDGYITPIPTTQPFVTTANGQFGYNTTADQYIGQRGGLQRNFLMEGDIPSAADPISTGTILMFAGSVLPVNYLLCYGQAVNRVTYAGLFNVIGTSYGTGDGSTTFNIPDFRGLVPGGLDNMGGVAASRVTSASLNGANSTTLGGIAGEQTHTLSIAEMPAHTHTYTHPSGSVNNQRGSNVAGPTDISDTTSSAGSGTAHNNMQPTTFINFMIKI